MRQFFVRAMPCKRGRPAGLSGSSNPRPAPTSMGLRFSSGGAAALGTAGLGVGSAAGSGTGCVAAGCVAGGASSGSSAGCVIASGASAGSASSASSAASTCRAEDGNGRAAWLWVVGGGMLGGQEGEALSGAR